MADKPVPPPPPKPQPEPDGPICDRCGRRMYDRHCKILCPWCGYQRDCSDP